MWHELYHLVLDFVRNDWMVGVGGGETISIPILSNDIEMEEMREEIIVNKRTGWSR